MRENCTSGAVRWASGNRGSYRKKQAYGVEASASGIVPATNMGEANLTGAIPILFKEILMQKVFVRHSAYLPPRF